MLPNREGGIIEVTMPKNPVEPVEAEELVVVDEPLELEDAPLADVPDAVLPIEGPVAVVPGKKPVGVKEIIPFAWKLVGQANGLYLTLFKSIEREDSDAQLERVQRDGYYTNLRVMPVNEKIEQPKPAKSAKKTDAAHSKEALKTFGTRTVAKLPAAEKEPKVALSRSAKELREAAKSPNRILVASKPAPVKAPSKSSKSAKAAAAKTAVAGKSTVAAKTAAPAKTAATAKSSKSARPSKSSEPATAAKKKPAAAKSAPKKPAKARK